MYQKIQKVSVKGIIERGGKVLLVKDTKGVWELPGGRIEHGEDPRESLLRELNEELGWSKVVIQEIIDTWSFTSKIEDRHNHFIILVYSCSAEEDHITNNDEYTEYKWVLMQEIKELNMRDGYKRAIETFESKRSVDKYNS
jgi:8-oxo-dGTP diphosphatase